MLYDVDMAKKRRKKRTDAGSGCAEHIGMRVSVAEKGTFQAAADKANRTLSGWLLNLARIEIAKKR